MSVASGPMPVLVMIHRLIDKTFWASVAFGVLALATSALVFILKVLMCSHPEAFLLLGFLLPKPPGSIAHRTLLLPPSVCSSLFIDALASKFLNTCRAGLFFFFVCVFVLM